MCFSANVSILTSGILALIGTISLKKIKTKIQIPLALIPYFFAMQQFSEGILWLTLKSNNVYIIGVAKCFTYIYLTFAFFFWPMWIPFSVYMIENEKVRKLLLRGMLVIGTFVGIYGLFFIIINGGKAQILDHHILYDVNIPGILSTSFFEDKEVSIPKI